MSEQTVVFIPEDFTMEECLCVKEVLTRIKRQVLSGIPSGKVIDQALDETLTVALRSHRKRAPRKRKEQN